MSITTFDINGVDYVSYATVQEANNLLAIDATRSAAWAAIQDDKDKMVRLAGATVLLDALSWKGSRAGGPTQVNAWPRDGVTYPSGEAVPDNVVPKAVEDACILLAGTIARSPTATTPTGGATSHVESIKAGDAEIKYAVGSNIQVAEPLQTDIPDDQAWKLIRPFLTGSSAASSGLFLGLGTPRASGTSGQSFHDEDY